MPSKFVAPELQSKKEYNVQHSLRITEEVDAELKELCLHFRYERLSDFLRDLLRAGMDVAQAERKSREGGGRRQ